MMTPTASQAQAAIHLLQQIMGDLPQRRDWLDPMVERSARALIRSAGHAEECPQNEFALYHDPNASCNCIEAAIAEDSLEDVVEQEVKRAIREYNNTNQAKSVIARHARERILTTIRARLG